MSAQALRTLGWREWVGLPELGITRIHAKVDTGARTSCLHAYFVQRLHGRGTDRVRFGIHPLQDNTTAALVCEAELIDQRVVTDSGGHREQRYVIRTQAWVADCAFPAELTLTNRDSMRFRMLLGRTALAGRFVVDPNASHLAGEPACHSR